MRGASSPSGWEASGWEEVSSGPGPGCGSEEGDRVSREEEGEAWEPPAPPAGSEPKTDFRALFQRLREKK